MQTCSVPGCSRINRSGDRNRWLCSRHWQKVDRDLRDAYLRRDKLTTSRTDPRDAQAVERLWGKIVCQATEA